jgi:hypothetical protein
MVILYGRMEYDIVSSGAHDVVTSTGAEDVGVLTPPDDASGFVLSVEDVPVRLTFDGKTPTASYGVLLRPGESFLPFAREIRFISVHDQRAATVSVLWIRVKLAPAPST